jgi:hypothetical protein
MSVSTANPNHAPRRVTELELDDSAAWVTIDA